MKKLFCTFLFSFALAGCVSLPQNAEELKSMSSSNSFVESTSYQTTRSFLDVNDSLREGSQRCLNKTQERTFRTPAPGSSIPLLKTTITRYETRFNASDTAGQMTMRMIPIVGRAMNEPEEGYIYFVAETKPISGGTTISIYGSSTGDSDLKATVKSWVQTGEISCPELIR